MDSAAKAARDMRRANPADVAHPPHTQAWVDHVCEAHGLSWRAREFTIAEAERHCTAQRHALFDELEARGYSFDEVCDFGLHEWRVLTPYRDTYREVVCPECDGQGSHTSIGAPGYFDVRFGNYLPSEEEHACRKCNGYETIEERVVLPAFLLAEES